MWMKVVRNVLTATAIVGVLAVAALKALNGEPVSWQEVTLTVTTLAAGAGFQYAKPDGK